MSAPSEKDTTLSADQRQNLEAFDHDGHQEQLGATLSSLTSQCANEGTEAHETILAPANSSVHSERWGLAKYLKAGVAKITRDAAYYHYGNYVADRATGVKTFEQMPLYTRLGMHILYCGSIETAMLKSGYMQQLFLRESIAMGKTFDDPASKSKIPGFIAQFKLDTSDLARPDPTSYENFNDFFARGLRKGARPVAEPEDESVAVSSADCRLVVFPSLDLARAYWVKGRRFTIPQLLGGGATAEAEAASSQDASHYDAGALAIFRLAPQDYHRWHAPFSGRVTKIVDLDGCLMTVNPMAINEDLNVYTENKRSIAFLQTRHSATPVLVVAVGAMLVGSIAWTVREGDEVRRGEEMGLFKYGGSTVLMITPADMDFHFDEDLVRMSEGVPCSGNLAGGGNHLGAAGACETLVKVGWRVGKVMAPGKVTRDA